ncbi:Multicopper oxidase [Phytophthora megakarya]|uniref:Multicopper oxidase n=1 Tax=Phytophthora megakarya TaxID=4795 RepID=A0A225VZF3_9STRA|nr:Multicopper oxidase [Phytophthora megakarya]
MWDNILINSRGRYNCTAAYHHNFTECTDEEPLSKFHLQAGNKYLLRLINMGALSPIVFSIDDHEFRVVAADGEYLQPSELINSVFINVGQRLEIIVETKSNIGQKSIGSFWMRANGLHGLPWTTGNASTAGEGYTYEGQLFLPIALPQVASSRHILQVKMQGGLGHIKIDEGDFHHFQHPPQPPLFTIAAGMTTEQLPLSSNAFKIISSNALKVEFGKHIEVVLANVQNEQHPFHIHTHSPWIVGSGVASLDQIRNNQLPPLKLVNPIIRDVYTVPQCTSDGNNGCLDAGYVVLRFTADNPGVWIFHCHIDWHLEAGMSMILVEGEQELQQRGVNSFANTMLSVCGSNSTFSIANSLVHEH